MSLNDKLWFVTHIDRYFLTNRFGNEPTLYTNLLSESMIKYDILKYTKIENGIKVETGCNQTIELKGRPSKKELINFIYNGKNGIINMVLQWKTTVVIINQYFMIVLNQLLKT